MNARIVPLRPPSREQQAFELIVAVRTLVAKYRRHTARGYDRIAIDAIRPVAEALADYDRPAS